MSSDSLMIEFCDVLERKMLAKDSRSEVLLKRIPSRIGIYVVICVAGTGEQEAYEINGCTGQWIKVYG